MKLTSVLAPGISPKYIDLIVYLSNCSEQILYTVYEKDSHAKYHLVSSKI